MTSLFKTMSPSALTLEEALALMRLPRTVGTDPATGEEIVALNGRYGPYLRRGSETRSLATEDELFTVTLDEAVRLFAEPKRRGREPRGTAARAGTDPVTGKPMVIRSGRYGPYVTDGETNAALREREGDTVEGLTVERAAELLQARREAGPSTRGAQEGHRPQDGRQEVRNEEVGRQEVLGQEVRVQQLPTGGSALAFPVMEARDHLRRRRIRSVGRGPDRRGHRGLGARRAADVVAGRSHHVGGRCPVGGCIGRFAFPLGDGNGAGGTFPGEVGGMSSPAGLEPRGRFIVFEGGEGSGKSTQSARLAERLGAVLHAGARGAPPSASRCGRSCSTPARPVSTTGPRRCS